MTTTPVPTGKIKGSLRDVTPKLRNFVGAVKVTTSSGKGGILMEMGKPVAAYLTVKGVLHRARESLELLEKEQLAEFEILRYDEEQFREAMVICENRGLLLGEGKGAAPAPSRPKEAKPKEENVLSAMMKRFVAPKVAEKREPVTEAKKAEALAVPPAAGAAKPEPKVLEPLLPPPPLPGEKVPPIQERREAAPQETELSAIIKRLRESAKAEKEPAQPEKRAEEMIPKAGVPGPEIKATAEEPTAPPVQKPTARVEEKLPGEPALPPRGGAAAPEGHVRVDLGKMMKRIKRLDITSIREELQAGTEGERPAAPGGAREVLPSPGGEPGTPAMVPGEAIPPAAGTRGKSDIDELKAFIQRLEVLEETKEPPPVERRILAKLGVKTEEVPAPAPPRKREIPVPVPRVVKAPEEAPKEEAVPEPTAPVREAPRPAEPDRKAKIASLLRRSGLVKPPVEEQPGEIITEILPEPAVPPGVPKEVEEPVAPSAEVEIRVPKAPRRKVEITRVPKKPEKPPREPPLIDERMIQKILKQPGVIAVSTFFEGFAVQSAGRADFEQVAANAEDLFRAGKKIAREIDIGPLNQIILETGKGKLVIAPYGDLNVCIFTEPDANLGLIRVAIKSMQAEKG
jgi:predicted regulator of Ras-like GTPase activity (Roadblock/LC7/MglB family)